MKYNKLIILFFIIITIYFTATFLSLPTVQLITKPLIVSSLLMWYLMQTKSCVSSLKIWIVLALIFCIMGDTLLMFDSGDNLFFILGLSAFLLAHLFFITAFIKVKRENHRRFKWYQIVFPLIYFFGIMTILLPKAGDLKIPLQFMLW